MFWNNVKIKYSEYRYILKLQFRGVFSLVNCGFSAKTFANESHFELKTVDRSLQFFHQLLLNDYERVREV